MYNRYYINGKNPLQFAGGSAYPRVQHAKQLEKDTIKLEQQIRQHSTGAPYGDVTYPYLCNEAIRLAHDLRNAHQQFIGNEEYTQEWRAKLDAEQKAEEFRQQTEFQKRQLRIQQQQLRESQKANDLAALNQRFQARSLTQKEYAAELESINNKYWWSGIVDTVTHR